MSNFYLIVLRQKLDIMVHFQTFITHKHKYKINFTHFIFIMFMEYNNLISELTNFIRNNYDVFE